MFNQEQFKLDIRAIADNIPDHFKGTIGGNMFWIISQAFIQHFQPKLAELEARIEELENVDEERELQSLQRDEAAQTKVSVSRRRKE